MESNTYIVKQAILGFEGVNEVSISKIDETFSLLKSKDENLALTLINPFALKTLKYDFSVPTATELLLEIDKDKSVEVYCVVVLQKPLENSVVSLLAPIVINPAKKLCAQVTLSMKEYPHFSVVQPLKLFLDDTQMNHLVK